MWTALCIVVLSLVALSASGALKDDVELIPEEQRTASANVGKSLSLGLDDSEWKRRNFIAVVDDQLAAGSEFYGPAVGSYEEMQRKEGDSYRVDDARDSRGEVGFYGSSGHKGSKGQVSENGYAADHQAHHGDKHNSGYYGDNSGAHKAYNAGQTSYGDQSFNRQGQSAAAFGSRGGHRKGHHSSGFKNSYYKDESGNNSRFFDDANDEGGHYLYDARNGGFRDSNADTYRGSYDDGAYQDTARGKQDKFGSTAGYDNSRGYKGRYAHDDYHDDKEGYNQQKGGESFGRKLHGGRNEEASRVYHNAAEVYGKPVIGGYVSPSGVYNYESKPDYYSPKAYHTQANYPVPYNNFYKGKAGQSASIGASPYDGAIKGKGYAEYLDAGASNYYPQQGGQIAYYDEPNYYSFIN
jgi:hypothetical protein